MEVKKREEVICRLSLGIAIAKWEKCKIHKILFLTKILLGFYPAR